MDFNRERSGFITIVVISLTTVTIVRNEIPVTRTCSGIIIHYYVITGNKKKNLKNTLHRVNYKFFLEKKKKTRNNVNLVNSEPRARAERVQKVRTSPTTRQKNYD